MVVTRLCSIFLTVWTSGLLAAHTDLAGSLVAVAYAIIEARKVREATPSQAEAVDVVDIHLHVRTTEAAAVGIDTHVLIRCSLSEAVCACVCFLVVLYIRRDGSF